MNHHFQIPQLPPVVSVMVTGVCDSNCPFCFGPKPSTPTLGIDAWLDIFRFLRANGALVLLLSGGEPVLRPDLDVLLREARRLGFRTSLATSCPSYDVSLKAALQADWCEISLHGSCPSIHELAGRATSNFQVVLDVLSRLAPEHSPLLKINTVVTPANADDLCHLARLLARYRVNTWKLSEVRPRGLARMNLRRVYLNYEEHWSLLRDVQALATALMPDTRVVISRASAGDNAYVVIDPDGRVLVPSGDTYADVGNMSDVAAWTPEETHAFLSRLGESVAQESVVREFETSFERISQS